MMSEKNEMKTSNGKNQIKIKVDQSDERKISKKTADVLRYVLLIVLAVIWLIPILWLFVTSFSAYPGINMSHFFPEEWTLSNYASIILNTDSVVQYLKWFENTFVIAIFSCIISTAFVLMTAYAMSVCRFKGRKTVMSLSLTLNLFPGVLSMVAVYFVMKSLGLTNSHLGMIIVYSAGSGLGFLIAKGFIDSIPGELREAATLDGCSEAGVFFRIILPLLKPIVVYQVICSFLVPWSDFVLAKLMLNSGKSEDWTVAIGLYNMLDRSLVNKYFSVFCAGGVLISIPISILFVIMQKFYVEGVTGGAVKS